MRRLRELRDGTAERGQALVETGLIISLILLLSLVTFDVGRAIFAHIALTEATQEGAVYAAYRPFPTSTIVTRVTTSSNHEAVTGASVTRPTCTTSPAPGVVVVRSTYNLPLISPPAQVIFGSTITLESEITASNFNGACS